MKNFFGTLLLFSGLAVLVILLVNLDEFSWWVTLVPAFVFLWGLEIIIRGIIEESIEKSELKMSSKISGVKDEIAYENRDLDKETLEKNFYVAAQNLVVEAGKASTSYLQRKLRINYKEAEYLMDILESRGVIEKRDVLNPSKARNISKNIAGTSKE